MKKAISFLLVFITLLVQARPGADSIRIAEDTVKGINQAKSAFSTIDKLALWVNSLSNKTIQQLPVGVQGNFGEKGNSNVQIALGVTKASLYPEYAELTVFARVRLPQTDASGKPFELFFGADKIKLSYEGGIIGNANLVLLGDVDIPFNANKWMLTLKGGFDYSSGKLENLTYVTIDCDGIKEMGISGAVEFSRDLILPVESNGEVDEAKTTVTVTRQTEKGTSTEQVPYRVKGEFQTVVSDWNDMLLGVSLQPFVLKEKRNGTNYNSNFLFNVNNAVLDLSDLRNSSSVKFPQYYEDHGLLLPNSNTWRGVYIETVEVKMPKEFMTSKTVERKERVTFGSHNLIIDSYGVSGNFYADNLIPLKEGITNDQKAWAYSVDHIGVSLAASTLTGADFNGKIILPVSNQDNEKVGLSYTGLISQKEYLMTVKNDSIIDFNIWKAHGRLEPNSYVEFKVTESKFRPKAVLNGSLNISASQNETSDKSIVSFEGIKFQNLVLQTVYPIFAVDYMGYQNTGERKMSNFPVTISEIGIKANESAANLYFGVAVNLMGNESGNGFAGSTHLTVLGQFEEVNRKQKWKYKGLQVDRISLEANLGAVKLKGFLDIMNDDPEYGDGFNAHLEGTFGSFGPVTCNAIFGSTTFRYWMVDGAVEGLNIGTGVINLSGFAGGASYHMLRKTGGATFSPTGLGYTPNKDTGLGVKAMVSLNIGSDKAINGGAGFEIIFNTHGGVNQLGFYGNIQVMKAASITNKLAGLTDKLKTVVGKNQTVQTVSNSTVGKNFLDMAVDDYPTDLVGKSAISAYLGMQQDFVNKVFHAELEIYVNVANVITGRGPNNRAARGVIHVAPDEWYTYLGKPSDRAGLKVGFGSVSINAGGYFMVGDRLEPSPPPPPIVAEILGVDVEQLNYMRDENALSGARGFSFGQDFSIDTGDMRFLMFYARFQAGGGFDIMLRDYGEAQCVNTGEKPGINGWYANGQAYAYLQGELGIRIKLFFIKKKIPIIKAGAAVLFQTKAPNPIWMRGYLGGHFSVLGGLIKGSFRFKMTLGKECEFAEEYPLGGIKIIADLSPSNDSEADVFAIPQATFAMKVGEDVVIPEDEGDKTYKIVMEKFRILDEGKELEGKLDWSEYKDRAGFVSKEILPPNKKLSVEVEVSFMEKVNGVYRPVMVDGKVAKETEVRNFTTGGAPDVIPLQNIQYAYPVLDQKYFFTEEYNKGYIQLKRGQNYLFDDAQWMSQLNFTDKNGKAVSAELGYDRGNNQVNYTLPKMELSNTYHISIISKLKEGKSSSDTPETTYTQQDTGDEDNTVLVQQNTAQNLSKDGEIERLSYDFSTSMYKTFKNKVNSISVDEYNFSKLYSDVIYLTNKIKDHESFDLVELTGSIYTDHVPTISVEAALDDNYFTKDINPPLYSNYPMGGRYNILNRDSNEYGIPPSKALPIYSSYLTYVEYGVNGEWLRTTFPYYYNLPYYYKSDWIDLQGQIINDYVGGILSATNPAMKFLDENYKFIREGNYKIKLMYRLPGGIDGTQEIVTYKNRIQ